MIDENKLALSPGSQHPRSATLHEVFESAQYLNYDFVEWNYARVILFLIIMKHSLGIDNFGTHYTTTKIFLP